MAPEPALLSGATGLVGGAVLEALTAGGVPVRALTRDPARLPDLERAEALAWDGVTPPPGALDGVGVVVHLAGEPIFGGLPTAARRARIRESRIASTRALVNAIAARTPDTRPRALVCASAVGIYGDRGEHELREDAAPGEGFLAGLCVDWEAEAARVEALGVRRVSLRFGLVLSREGGALPRLATLFRLGLGGRLGSGRQWFPWLHRSDAVDFVVAAATRDDLAGPVNAVAPGLVRNADFTRSLARAVGRPALFAVPAFALRAALGALAGELLGSRHVVPARAIEAQLGWRQPELDAALRVELGGAD